MVTALKGAGQSEHISFVELYASLQQQLAVFLFEFHLSVMLLLSLDVIDQSGNLAGGAGERPVSLLPVRKLSENRILLDPCAEPVFTSLTKSAKLTVGCRLVRM